MAIALTLMGYLQEKGYDYKLVEPLGLPGTDAVDFPSMRAAVISLFRDGWL